MTVRCELANECIDPCAKENCTIALEMMFSLENQVECDSMNGETAELLAPYLRHKDFNTTKVKSVSAPAAGLVLWVQAMARYYE